MISVATSISKIKFSQLVLVLTVLILLVIGKDLLHSSVQNYSFYLSESLLFGSFWIVFVPLLSFKMNGVNSKLKFMMPFAYGLLHLVLFSLFVFLVSSLFFNHTFRFSQIFINTTAEYGIVCLLVYGVHQVFLATDRKPLVKLQSEKLSDKIKVTYKNKVIVLHLDDIQYVKSEKPYIALVTKENKYLIHGTLKTFLEKKATKTFIQIHKSTIVNTNFILSYTSRKNGDYDVLLDNQHSIRASRSYNVNFQPFFDAIRLK